MFKIRASAAGKIMSGNMGLTDTQESTLRKHLQRHGDVNAKPLTEKMLIEMEDLLQKKENPKLPQGAKTYCKDWYKQKLYKKEKLLTTKYTSKGIIVEEDAIDIVSEYLGWGLVQKNEKFFENKHMTGTPDLVLADSVPDIKNSWDFTTFPLFESKFNSDYYWQLQVYMELCNKDKAQLIYVLMDAPEHFIEAEARRQAFQLGYDIDNDLYESVKYQMTYEDVPLELRVKVFDIERNDDDIRQVYERVELCRDYLKVIKLNTKP